MKREELTPRQREVVSATEKVVLVLGGPGTGKTTTALWAARETLQRSETSSWQRVSFLTFSRAAVGQIARRAPGVFSGDRERIEISTFHGFAWRLLRAFGRYAGHGKDFLELQSDARTKLLGRDGTQLVYDDLIPAALDLLRSERIRKLVLQRWPLVICDEFQDTSNEQWQLLRILGASSRLLLLGDGNQMIYAFLREKGVSHQRLEEAQNLAGHVIALETQSHRDPSGLIPTMAEAVRKRDFEHEAISHAVQSGKLRVFVDVNEELLTATVANEVARVRTEGIKNIGIFAHSNEGVATLSASLAENGLEHGLVGRSEAPTEALTVMASLCNWGIGCVTDLEVRIDVAAFLTACTPGRKIPQLALAFAKDQPVPPLIERRLQGLKQTLQEASGGTLGDLIKVAGLGWETIGATRGNRLWQRAYSDFIVLARRLSSLPASEATVNALKSIIGRRRPSALVEFDMTQTGLVQLMNFHQTKGREAEAVFLVYRPGDYLANRSDEEPYEESSRVLFVALTRAQQQVVVILPPDPHPLVAPFAIWG